MRGARPSPAALAAGRAFAAGAGCGPAPPGESRPVAGYLAGPAAPRRAAFPGHALRGAAQALEAPASCCRGGAAFPAALQAADKAGRRRKRLARGLPFTRVEISRGQRLPASLKMGFPERPNEKPSRDQRWGFRGDAATPRPPPAVRFRERTCGRREEVPFVPPAAGARGGGGEGGAGPRPLTCPRRAAPRLPLVCARLIRSGNSFPFL